MIPDMAIELDYKENENVLVATVKGAIDINEFAVAADDLITSADCPSDVNALWDLTEMEFHEADYTFAQKLIALREGLQGHRGKAKIALFSNYNWGEPILNMYKFMSEGLPQEVRVFANREEAMAWLR